MAFDIEFGDGVERDGEADVFALHLVEDGRRVNAIQREVVVIKTVAGESDCALIASAVVDRAGR